MAWVLSLKRNGEDLYPKLKEVINDKETWNKDPVRFEILRHFSYFVTESSEHMAEYVPYFMRNKSLIEKLNIPVREYLTRLELNEKVFVKNKTCYVEGRKELKDVGGKMTNDHHSKQSGDGLGCQESSEHQKPDRQFREYAAQIINCLDFGVPGAVYGTVPNRDFITNLPCDAMVEVPISIENKNLWPPHIGELPAQLAALNITHINVQRLAVKAALMRKREYIHYAALLDPLTCSVLSPDEIHDMVDELIAANRQYLCDFKK